MRLITLLFCLLSTAYCSPISKRSAQKLEEVKKENAGTYSKFPKEQYKEKTLVMAIDGSVPGGGSHTVIINAKSRDQKKAKSKEVNEDSNTIPGLDAGNVEPIETTTPPNMQNSQSTVGAPGLEKPPGKGGEASPEDILGALLNLLHPEGTTSSLSQEPPGEGGEDPVGPIVGALLNFLLPEKTTPLSPENQGNPVEDILKAVLNFFSPEETTPSDSEKPPGEPGMESSWTGLQTAVSAPDSPSEETTPSSIDPPGVTEGIANKLINIILKNWKTIFNLLLKDTPGVIGFSGKLKNGFKGIKGAVRVLFLVKLTLKVLLTTIARAIGCFSVPLRILFYIWKVVKPYVLSFTLQFPKYMKKVINQVKLMLFGVVKEGISKL